jgi:hypothetical protein
VRFLLGYATFLYLLARFWGFAELSLLVRPREQETKKIAWFYIAGVFMDLLPTFLVVWLVFLIGIRKKNGIHSWTRVEG